MHQSNTKLISFGLNKFDPTFVHYVEQFFDENIKINYRKNSNLREFLKKNKQKNPFFFMRPLNSKDLFWKKN